MSVKISLHQDGSTWGTAQFIRHHLNKQHTTNIKNCSSYFIMHFSSLLCSAAFYHQTPVFFFSIKMVAFQRPFTLHLSRRKLYLQTANCIYWCSLCSLVCVKAQWCSGMNEICLLLGGWDCLVLPAGTDGVSVHKYVLLHYYNIGKKGKHSYSKWSVIARRLKYVFQSVLKILQVALWVLYSASHHDCILQKNI